MLRPSYVTVALNYFMKTPRQSSSSSHNRYRWGFARRTLWLTCAVSTFFVAACGEKTQQVSWSFEFADPALAARSSVVLATIREGTCADTDAPLRYQQELRAGVETTPPPKLSSGTYALAGRAVDVSCVSFAEGCVEMRVPSDTSEWNVVLSASAGLPLCAAASCVAGSCATSSADGGTTDGGPTDASVSGDASTNDAATCDPDACPGRRCELGACSFYSSCNALHLARAELGSGVYAVDVDGTSGATEPFDVYCEMTREEGGWTLAMKVDGTQNTWLYDDAIWTSGNLLNEASTNLDRTEAKLAPYLNMPFTELLIGMDDFSNTPRWAALSLPSSQGALVSTFASDNYIPTTLGRSGWLALISSSALQPNCNQEGINNRAASFGVRIGILGNNENECSTPDSYLGIGVEKLYSACTGTFTARTGNGVVCMTGPTDIPAFAYVFVR
jgi:hypothetical protein